MLRTVSYKPFMLITVCENITPVSTFIFLLLSIVTVCLVQSEKGITTFGIVIRMPQIIDRA